MGQPQGQGFSLVSMTNSDVYYISDSAAKELMDFIERGETQLFFITRDVKNNTEIAIAVSKISSVVKKEAQDANR